MTDITTETVTSADGTTITFDRHDGGDAGTVILVGGALSHRGYPKIVELAAAIAGQHRLTVLNYDRRGRGDSGDTPGVYDVAHEIEDLAALVTAAGGAVSLFGISSGAVLALRAAAATDRIKGIHRVVAFEPPFVVGREHHVPPADLTKTLHELVAADRRSEAVRFYMTKAMGIPGVVVAVMRLLPLWSALKKTAPSTPHDWAAVGEFMRGEPLRRDEWAPVHVPTLVLVGGKSEPLFRTAGEAIVEVLPSAEYREIPGLGHIPNAALLAPVVGEFVTAAASSVPPPLA